MPTERNMAHWHAHSTVTFEHRLHQQPSHPHVFDPKGYLTSRWADRLSVSEACLMLTNSKNDGSKRIKRTC